MIVTIRTPYRGFAQKHVRNILLKSFKAFGRYYEYIDKMYSLKRTSNLFRSQRISLALLHNNCRKSVQCFCRLAPPIFTEPSVESAISIASTKFEVLIVQKNILDQDFLKFMSPVHLSLGM